VDRGRACFNTSWGEHLTIPDTHGVFIAETWRMHPDVCEFISKQIYENRLTSHVSCAQQSTEFGTGLRWLETHHVRRSTESVEEAGRRDRPDRKDGGNLVGESAR